MLTIARNLELQTICVMYWQSFRTVKMYTVGNFKVHSLEYNYGAFELI